MNSKLFPIIFCFLYLLLCPLSALAKGSVIVAGTVTPKNIVDASVIAFPIYPDLDDERNKSAIDEMLSKLEGVILRANVTSKGKYKLRLPLGVPFRLMTSAPGYLPEYTDVITFTDADAGKKREYNFSLTFGATISGTINKMPNDNVWVVLEPYRPVPVAPFSSSNEDTQIDVRIQKVNRNGQYSFTGIRPGEYDVRIISEKYGWLVVIDDFGFNDKDAPMSPADRKEIIQLLYDVFGARDITRGFWRYSRKMPNYKAMVQVPPRRFRQHQYLVTPLYLLGSSKSAGVICNHAWTLKGMVNWDDRALWLEKEEDEVWRVVKDEYLTCSTMYITIAGYMGKNIEDMLYNRKPITYIRRKDAPLLKQIRVGAGEHSAGHNLDIRKIKWAKETPLEAFEKLKAK